MHLPFSNRREAGRALAERMSGYAGRRDLLVLALPRGGVPVAFEIAEALDAELDVVLVRKLGVPGQEELAMGAIASGGALVLNRDTINAIGIDEDHVEAAIARERRELERREEAYRGDRPHPRIEGRPVILVDDGLATGSSMLAAVSALRGLHPAEIIVAVPVAPSETCEALRREVDAVNCATIPAHFRGVGAWYVDFSQTSDEEVRELLNAAWVRKPGVPAPTGTREHIAQTLPTGLSSWRK